MMIETLVAIATATFIVALINRFINRRNPAKKQCDNLRANGIDEYDIEQYMFKTHKTYFGPEE